MKYELRISDCGMKNYFIENQKNICIIKIFVIYL